MQAAFPFIQPAGFEYVPDFLSPEESVDLARIVPTFSLAEFKFHGYLGHRRVASFGWSYDFAHARLQKAAAIPDSLLPLRTRIAALAGLDASQFEQVLVTEYRPGTVIGWHRDKAVFGQVAGVSLLSDCTFRFRHKEGTKWHRFNQQLQPRSAYLLRGPIRDHWEHSIPPVPALRYSITFRTLR